MKKLTLITLTLVLMLGSTLHAAKKPDFTPQEIEQVKQMAVALKVDNMYHYGQVYKMLLELKTFNIVNPINFIQTWATNWQSGTKQVKEAQRLLYAAKFPVYPKDWDNLFYTTWQNFKKLTVPIEKKLHKYKYKKYKGGEALGRELDELINTPPNK